MVPNFALSLSFDGIALLRRVSSGWVRSETVALDSDDLDGALRRLRETALAHGPDGAEIMLLLPNEQIRYLDLPDPGGDYDTRARTARTALEGMTPYAVNDLVIDWSLIDSRLCIAAVARETLDEAGSFVAAQGFVPVSFAALPPADSFSGDVFFGPAPSWTGPVPLRPADPVRIVPEPETGPEAIVDADAPEEPQQPEHAAEAEAPAPERPAALPDPAPVIAKAVPEAPDADDEAAEADPHEDADEDPKDELVPVFRTRHDPSNPAEIEFAPLRPRVPATPPAATTEPAENKPLFPASRLDVTPPPAARPDSVAALAPGAADDIPPPRSGGRTLRSVAPTDESAPISFTSIRATRDVPRPGGAGPAAPRLDAPRAPEGTGAPAITLDPPAAAAAEAPAAAPGTEGFFSRRRSRDKGGAAQAAAAPVTTEEVPAPPAKSVAALLRRAPRKTAEPEPEAAAAPTPEPKAHGKRVAAPIRTNDAPRPPAEAASASVAVDADEERRRMTVFGARGNDQIGGKPRFLGLMLTLVLLVFLAGVAAWASVFLDTGLSRFFAPPAETETDFAALPAEALPAPDPEPQQMTAEEEESEDTELASLETPGVTSDAENAPEALTSPVPRVALSPEAAEATYAATGIWQRAPSAPLEPPQTGTDDIYVASIDPSVRQLDAIALPDFSAPRGDVTLLPVLLPPGPFDRFDLDERGLVRATPEGAISPDGIRVFTGRPPQTPPQRDPVEAAPDAAPETGAATGTGDTAAPAPGAPETLRDSRPEARPGDLVEQTERVTLRGNSVAELAAKRPQLRPPSAQEQASAAQVEEIQDEVADAVAEAREADLPEEPEIDATAQAVVRSLTPNTRPGNMSALVRRAETEAPAEEVRTASAGPIRVQPGPKVPQTASVARSATTKNQINLRQVSLIGIYGKASSRRALLRLPSGRYQKVQVGDRVDGGRVAAIGETELQYSKGGRSIVLKMPRG
ncbi:hypothetical protein [Salipiger sp.]|uniref:hypothetical protein n=1 Tax=Salipiger sp. TaxID=2078585 RepID=UPI003A98557C